MTTWLKDWLTKQRLSSDFSLTQLAGDGSTRTFYRVESQSRKWILLSDPSWTLSKDYPAHQEFLKKRGIPVPEFFAHDPKIGCLLMEDLGDELLQFRLLNDPKSKLDWLKRSIELLAELHGKTYPVPTTLPVSERRFDQQKYAQELQFTLEHLDRGLLKQKAANSQATQELMAFCARIAAVPPDVFCHRDYHTRNLLVHSEKLVMIDFQDARLGAPQYDVASLLYDPYVPLSASDRRSLLNLYLSRVKTFSLAAAIPWDQFEASLKQIAYQRLLKAAGSYASFYTRFGKATHLPYLLPALTTALELRKADPEALQGLDEIFPLEKWIELSQHLKLQ